MKIDSTPHDDRRRLVELLEPMSVAMMSTLGDDGRIESRPMHALEMDGDGALWFFTSSHSSKVEHLQRVNLAFADTKQQTFVSIAGRGELVRERGQLERLWTPMARPWFPQGTDSPDLVLLRVVPEDVEYWDAPSGKMTRLVAMAASVVGGKPVGMGEHGHLDPAGRG